MSRELDDEQSLFPLRDSREKLAARHSRTFQLQPSLSLARLFVSLDYPWAERETARGVVENWKELLLLLFSFN